MKASQLIQELRAAIERHGDLPVTVYNGLDPSDEEVAEEVEYTERRYIFLDGIGSKHPHLHIR